MLDEPWLVRRGLDDLNYEEAAVQQFIRAYHDLSQSSLPRSAVSDRMREMLGRRQITEEETWEETIRVPLFSLRRTSCPRCQGQISGRRNLHSGERLETQGFRPGNWPFTGT